MSVAVIRAGSSVVVRSGEGPRGSRGDIGPPSSELAQKVRFSRDEGTLATGQTTFAIPFDFLPNVSTVTLDGQELDEDIDYDPSAGNEIELFEAITEHNQVLRVELFSWPSAYEQPSSQVMFVPNGPGAVNRSVQGRLIETISVLDYVPGELHAAILDGTSTDDVTAYIDAAVAVAAEIEYREIGVDFPSGKYCVTRWDLTGVQRVTFRGLGTVQIVGIDDTESFIVGSSVYADGDPDTGLPWVGDPPFNRGIKFTGGPWLIGPASGELYDCGMDLEGFVECRFENLMVSGLYGSGVTGDRTTVRTNISFVNTFSNCSFGNPGAPAGGFKAYCLAYGSNNVNLITFDTCRFVGAGPGVAGTTAVLVTSADTVFNNCDLSSVETIWELQNAASFRAINCYAELVKCVLDARVGNSKAPRIEGGTYEIYDGGTAVKLGSSEEANVVGARWRAGTGCTFVDLGSACYGRTIHSNATDPAHLFDTWETGTEHGHGDNPSREAEVIKAARVMFPPTAVPSADPNTLDDYREDTWSPVAGGGVTFTAAAGSYTKKGDEVTLHFAVTWPASGNGNGAKITGLPFVPSDATIQKGAALGFQINPNGYVPNLVAGELAMINPATGVAVTNTNCINLVLHGTVIYKTAS